ncbi:MAG TPA: hypothetical protein VF796_06250, partial [Humisphaera sp.]
PPGEWLVKDQPRMKSFIQDPKARAAAEAEWERKLREGWKDTRLKRAPVDYTRNSASFLSGILKIKSDHCPLVGTGGTSRYGVYYRYYVTNRWGHAPEEGKPAERVGAKLVEGIVTRAMREMLRSVPRDLDRKVAKFVEEYRRELRVRFADSEALRREKAELEAWYKSTFSVASARGKSLLADEAKRTEDRLDEIERLLATKPHDALFADLDVHAVVASVSRQFAKLADASSNADAKMLRAMSEVFVASLTLDPPTGEIEAEFALPAWALTRKDAIIQRVLETGTNDFIGSACKNSQDSLILHRAVGRKPIRRNTMRRTRASSNHT